MAKKKAKKTKRRGKKKGSGPRLLGDTQQENPAAAAADAVPDAEPEAVPDRPPIVLGGAKDKAANESLNKAISKEVRGNNWMPKVEDDAIYGQVHDSSWISNQNGRYLSLQLEVEGERGELDIMNILANRVLRSQLQKEGVRKGDMIAIAYKGTQTGKRGAPYRLYAVHNETAEQESDGAFLVTKEDMDAEG